jgi:hypothetical protein
LAVCFAAVIITWTLQLLLNKKGSPGIPLKDNVETGISAIFEGKNDNLLPIDIETHKVAVDIHKNNLSDEKTITHLLRILSVEKKNRKITLDLASAYLKAHTYQMQKNCSLSLLMKRLMTV